MGKRERVGDFCFKIKPVTIMMFALSGNGNRIVAEHGLQGFCPGCYELLIPKCGIINVHHWSHDGTTSCDNWHYEPKTFWHKNWQELFHINDIEVGIKKTDEFHIADIVGNKDVVIEIQHSPISETEIRKREIFYDKMIWILNARSFVQNIRIGGIVEDYKVINKLSLFDGKKDSKGSYKSLRMLVPPDDDGTIKQALEANMELWHQASSSETRWHFKDVKYLQQHDLPEDIATAYIGHALDNKLNGWLKREGESYPIELTWKRLRKSWLAAEKPLFLDIGPSCMIWLTKRETGNKFQAKLISKPRFLTKYRKSLPG